MHIELPQGFECSPCCRGVRHVQGQGDSILPPAKGSFGETGKTIGTAGNLGGISRTVNVSEQINPAVDVDLFRFTVAAGERLWFDIDTATNGRPGLGSYLRIFDSSGRELAANNDAQAPDEPQPPPGELINEHRSAASDGFNTTHTYDPVGNRLVKNEAGSLTTSTFDAANQTITSVGSSGTTTYTFDATGNQQIEQAPSGTTTSTWNYENQRIAVLLPSGQRETMTYNADLRNVRTES